MSFSLSEQNQAKYEILEQRFLPDIHSDSLVLTHRKTGARIALLPNEDTNKVFYIGFRTPPTDSTGVAHIIEHTVLCGSDHFPVKDPFVELAKGSLNTFLNAMTYPDKTVYPVASVNDKDFRNLMHVYLDAVFYPLIYRNESIFRQEGWHYELSEKEEGGQELTLNGVVYNEMKGAFSSPDDVLMRKIYESLLPDTPYSVESGGDPDVIPQLTYEDYLDFHRRYYHPGNSYIYLYGNADMNERLAFLDEAYLSHFDRIDIDSSIPLQPPFDAPRETSIRYPVLEEESEEGKYYFALNYAFPPFEDEKELNTAFKILDYALSDAEGSPLTEALHEKGIGEDVYSIYENGLRQPCYSVIAKCCRKEDKEAFTDTVEQTLRALAEDGIPLKSLLSAISYYEFRYREAEFGSLPKGLVYGLSALDTWLYDRSPWITLEAGECFEKLRQKAKEGYFENLIRTYFLDNPHRVLVVMEPERGLEERNELKLKEQLAQKLQAMSAEETDLIREKEKAMRSWQEMPDSEENLQTLPILQRSDLNPDITPYINRITDLGEVSGRKATLVTHPLFTNGIDYLSLLFSADGLSGEEMRLLCVLKTLLGVVDTTQHGYMDLNEEINIHTGGVRVTASAYTDSQDISSYRLTFEVHVKALHDRFDRALELLKEILTQTDFAACRRIREVLEEERSGMRSDLSASGHVTTMTRASSYISETSVFMDQISGIEAYRTLDDVCSNYEERGDELGRLLRQILLKLACRADVIVDCIAQEEDLNELPDTFRTFLQDVTAAGEESQDTERTQSAVPYRPVPVKKNEGFITAGQVQYVCRAGSFLAHGYPYTGALRVLKVILGYDYLWSRVRMKGGAYGCMSGFSRDGGAFLASYRDPNLEATIDAYREAGTYIRSFDADERTMTKYIIGAVSVLDHPMTPVQYGRYSLAGYLTNLSEEQLRREREETLTAEPETIRTLADYLDAVFSDECLCVIGTKDKIEAAKDLFYEVSQLV